MGVVWGLGVQCSAEWRLSLLWSVKGRRHLGRDWAIGWKPGSEGDGNGVREEK